MSLNFISASAALGLKNTARFMDCRWTHKDSAIGGRNLFQASRIPNATFVDMDTILADKITPQTGRHPLPPLSQFTAWVTSQRLDTAPGTRVVVYDDAGGAIAARLWWMLRCVNFTNVSILEGGIQYWKDSKLPLTPPAEEIPQAQILANAKAPFSGPYPSSWEKGVMPIVDIAEIKRSVNDRHLLVLDARSAPRFNSPAEGPPTDPDAVSGHIPGSVNRQFSSNMARHNLLKPQEVLQAEFKELYGGRPISSVVSSCGSGVTACLNIAASEFAGTGIPALYVGSWSQWSKLHPKMNHDNAKF